MQVVTPQELQVLANKRAKQLKEYIVNQRGINVNKVSIKKAQNVQEQKESWVRTKMEIEVK
jgi:anion-transporting  ArsA/GET3 family ATPase